MFNNVVCVEKEEGRSTVGVFMAVGPVCLYMDVFSLFVKGCVEKSADCEDRQDLSLVAFPAHSLQELKLLAADGNITCRYVVCV